MVNFVYTSVTQKHNNDMPKCIIKKCVKNLCSNVFWNTLSNTLSRDNTLCGTAGTDEDLGIQKTDE